VKFLCLRLWGWTEIEFGEGFGLKFVAFSGFVEELALNVLGCT